MTARTIPVREWVVTARYPFPLIGQVPVYGIEATTPEHAVMQVLAMRDRLGLPQDCTYSARAVDTRNYTPIELCTDWVLFGTGPERKALEFRSAHSQFGELA